MNELSVHTNRVKYLKGDQIDRQKWDQCLDKADNGNICAYSWFLDVICNGWDGLVYGDYIYIMPVNISSRFGVNYLLQPRYVQQSGVFGKPSPDTETVGEFIKALPKSIKIVDYHFNNQNILSTGWDVEMRSNFILNIDKSYDELKRAYTNNLKRNLKKSDQSGFHIIKNKNPEPLIKLFREMNGSRFTFLKDDYYSGITRVIHDCCSRNKADVWNVYNKENELLGGVVLLFSHGRAVLYFSAQNKEGRGGGVLSWLIDTFICEYASTGMILDFEGSVHKGLARFYASFGAVLQSYPRLKINNFSPLFKLIYLLYKKMKKH